MATSDNHIAASWQEHVPVFIETPATVKCVCSCGWTSPRATCGNRAGWAYAHCAIADEWFGRHAKRLGFSFDGDRFRFNGHLIATIVDDYKYRLRGCRKVHSGDLASRTYVAITAMRRVLKDSHEQAEQAGDE